MIVTLRSFLARLEDEERFKPEAQRRTVPSVTELAKEVGLSRVQMQRVVGGDITSLKLSVGGGVIKALRERGFSADVNDILEYRDDPPPKAA
jgi:DNA-binding Xre family transcriptional regulator